MSLLRPGDTFPELSLRSPAARPSRCRRRSPNSAWCCSTAAPGVPTATPSCAPFSAPAPPWPTLASRSSPCRSTTKPPPRPHRQARPDLSRRFGADARAIAGLTGAFVNPDPAYLQSTGFVLDPAGKVVVSVYSSGAIGRLVPDDVAGLRALRAGSTSRLRRNPCLLFVPRSGARQVPIPGRRGCRRAGS